MEEEAWPDPPAPPIGLKVEEAMTSAEINAELVCPVSWHFPAMFTVGVCWLSGDTCIRSLNQSTCAYKNTQKQN